MKKLFVILCVLLGCVASSCRYQSLPVLDGGYLQVRGKNTYWAPDDFPILLLIDDEMGQEHIEATMEAAYAWNDAVDARVFQPLLWDLSMVAPRTYGFIAVSIRELGVTPHGVNIIGLHDRSAYHDNGHKKFAHVWYDEDDLDPEAYVPVMTHELGHGLCLAHDPGDIRSIMHNALSVEDPQYIMPDDVEHVLAQMGAYSTHLSVEPGKLLIYP